MENGITVAGFLAPVIFALLQAIKQTELVSKRWIPIVAIVLGVMFGAGYALLFKEPLATYLLGGLIGGLSSGGFYGIVKTTIGDE